MLLVADQNNRIALGGELAHLAMHLFDQRAGRVDDNPDSAGGGLLPHRRGDPVRAEDHLRPDRNMIDGLDENDAATRELLDDVALVDDFVKNIKRRAVFLKRPLHRLHRHLHPRAKAARLGNDDFFYCHAN